MGEQVLPSHAAEGCAADPRFGSLLEALRRRFAACAAAAGDPNTTCLPTRVSDPLVGQAGELVEGAIEAAQALGAPLSDMGCPQGLMAALATYARPLLHTDRGRWAAKTAFGFAGRGCWPTVGLEENGWPVTYREVLELELDAEAWERVGDEAENGRPPLLSMPEPLVNALTPVDWSSWPALRHLRGAAAAPAAGGPPRRLRVLSTGNHASYPAALFSLWRATLRDYALELEDYSFDTRYCSLAGSCSVDERFAWLGEHLRGTVVETCGGLFLKGFEDMPALADRLTGMLVAGGTASLAARADLLLCTHPPYSCRLFWPLVLEHGKPLLGFFGGTLEAHVPASGMMEWLRDFKTMATHPRVQFAAIAPFLAEKMRYQSGVDVPSVRAFGFHVLEKGAAYIPRRSNEVLVWKNSNECEENQPLFDSLLEKLARQAGEKHAQVPGGLRFRHLRPLREEGEASYASLASFRAVVFAPYEVLLMTFYELYHVAIPMFLPAAELSAFFMYRGPVTYPHCNMVLEPQSDDAGEGEEGRLRRVRAPYSPFARESATDRLAWLQAYTDWYRFPHLSYFSSLAALVSSLLEKDMQAISAAMRLETETALLGVAGYWTQAFHKVLLDPGGLAVT